MAAFNDGNESKENFGKTFLEIARQHFARLDEAPLFWCEKCRQETPHTKRHSGDCDIMSCMTLGCGHQKALRLK